jgi:hypothetical protein
MRESDAESEEGKDVTASTVVDAPVLAGDMLRP